MTTRQDIADHERTHPKAVEAFAKMTDVERVKNLSDLLDSVRAIVQAGVRMQYPDWTQEQVAAETARRVAAADGCG